MSAFLAGIPGLDDGSTTLGKSRDDLCTTAEHHQHHGFSGGQQTLDIFFLLAGQTQALTVSVLATQHHVLAHGSNDDVGRIGQRQGFHTVGLLARIHLAVQDRILPGTLVTATHIKLRLNLLSPVATTAIQQRVALGQTVLHAFQQGNDVGMVQVLLVHLPEIGHCGERIVAAHGPHRVGIGTREENFETRTPLRLPRGGVI